MPLYSAFTRYGHLYFSSRPSQGEQFYKALQNALGGNYDTTIGSRAEARIYATAMALARARLWTVKAANQMDPRRVSEMLPVQERIYGLVPGLRDSMVDRRNALVLERILPLGARYTAVTAALQAAIGSAFLYYRVTKRSEIVTFPSSPGAGPGNWAQARAGAVIKTVRLTAPLAMIGVATAHYAPLDAQAKSSIGAGDVVVVSTNNIGLAERVTVTSGTASTFTATFTKAHDAGDVCTTARFPYWTSSQQHVLVVVTPAGARDAEVRRKVNKVMRQIMRTWVRWDIVPSTDGLTTDAFKIDDSILGLTDNAAIEGVTFP